MQIVYLGLFSKVFNWVFNKVLSPITNFIGNILSKVLGWVFTKVLVPVLNFVINAFIEIWKVEIKILFSTALLKVNLALMAVVDAFEAAMDYFIGVKKITYFPNGKLGGGQSMTLLEALISMPIIRNVLLLLTVVGLALALVLTIIGVMKSTLDFDFENKRPVSAVMASFMKTCVQFLIIPFLSLFIIKLAQEILVAIEAAFKLQSSVSMASTICGMIVQKVDPTFANDIMSGKVGWYNLVELMKRNFFDYDYLSGIIVSLFLIGIMGTVVVVFVKRIFDVLLLYIVSPLFVATIPLDDGEKFGKWKEMFLGKLFTGFGSIIVMRLYLIIAPIVMSGDRLQFEVTQNFGQSSDELTYIIKLVFLVGGAFAMMKAGPMVTSLISYQASQDESETGQMTRAMMLSYSQKAMGMVSGSINKSIGKMTNPEDEKKNGQGNKFGNNAGKINPMNRKPIAGPGATRPRRNAINLGKNGSPLAKTRPRSNAVNYGKGGSPLVASRARRNAVNLGKGGSPYAKILAAEAARKDSSSAVDVKSTASQIAGMPPRPTRPAPRPGQTSVGSTVTRQRAASFSAGSSSSGFSGRVSGSAPAPKISGATIRSTISHVDSSSVQTRARSASFGGVSSSASAASSSTGSKSFERKTVSVHIPTSTGTGTKKDK